MGQLQPEDLPAIVEKRQLDACACASVMDNGCVVIGSLEGGIEAVLSPERAFALLDLLYNHRDLLYRLTQQPTPLPDWLRETPEQFAAGFSETTGVHPLPEAVQAWLRAQPAVTAYNREHPFISTEEEAASKPPSEKYLEIRLYEQEWNHLDELLAAIPTLHEQYEAPNSDHYEDDVLVRGPAVKVLSCKVADLSQEALHLLGDLRLETSVQDVLLPVIIEDEQEQTEQEQRDS